MHLTNQLKLLINVIYSSIICDSGQSTLTLGNHNVLDELLVILKKVPKLSQLPNDSCNILDTYQKNK